MHRFHFLVVVFALHLSLKSTFQELCPVPVSTTQKGPSGKWVGGCGRAGSAVPALAGLWAEGSWCIMPEARQSLDLLCNFSVNLNPL